MANTVPFRGTLTPRVSAQPLLLEHYPNSNEPHIQSTSGGRAFVQQQQSRHQSNQNTNTKLTSSSSGALDSIHQEQAKDLSGSLRREEPRLEDADGTLIDWALLSASRPIPRVEIAWFAYRAKTGAKNKEEASQDGLSSSLLPESYGSIDPETYRKAQGANDIMDLWLKHGWDFTGISDERVKVLTDGLFELRNAQRLYFYGLPPKLGTVPWYKTFQDSSLATQTAGGIYRATRTPFDSRLPSESSNESAASPSADERSDGGNGQTQSATKNALQLTSSLNTGADASSSIQSTSPTSAASRSDLASSSPFTTPEKQSVTQNPHKGTGWYVDVSSRFSAENSRLRRIRIATKMKASSAAIQPLDSIATTPTKDTAEPNFPSETGKRKRSETDTPLDGAKKARLETWKTMEKMYTMKTMDAMKKIIVASVPPNTAGINGKRKRKSQEPVPTVNKKVQIDLTLSPTPSTSASIAEITKKRKTTKERDHKPGDSDAARLKSLSFSKPLIEYAMPPEDDDTDLAVCIRYAHERPNNRRLTDFTMSMAEILYEVGRSPLLKNMRRRSAADKSPLARCIRFCRDHADVSDIPDYQASREVIQQLTERLNTDPRERW